MFLTGTYSAGKLHKYAVDVLNLTTVKRKRTGGNPIVMSRIYDILKDPIYAGFFYYGNERYELDTKLPRLITEAQHVKIWKININCYTFIMLESPPQNALTKVEQVPAKIEGLERPPYLDATALMKEKNCYFVHTIQVTKNLDVSENNRAIDTKKLTAADRLDILYAGNPTLSVSSLRPNTQDGTFYGGFGVLFSQGEVISANPSDDGTIAKSLTEREIIGGARNSVEDIDRAIDRKHGVNGKSYNEIVLKGPEVAGGFMKIDIDGKDKKRISFEEESMDYGAGGGEVVKKYGVLNLANEKNGAVFDTPFSVLLEMKSRGPVFFLNENNQMLQVTRIDEKTRKLTFSLKPNTPSDIAEVYGEHKLNRYSKQEMLDRLSGRNVNIG